MECEYTYIESERSSQKRGRFDKGRDTRAGLAGLGPRTRFPDRKIMSWSETKYPDFGSWYILDMESTTGNGPEVA